MQDTPNFDGYRNQFNQYTLPDLIDARERVDEPFRTSIQDAHRKISEYFADTEFRQRLSQNRKNTIEGQISNILAQFNELRQWQINGTQIAGANIQNIHNNISAYIDEIDLRFTDPHQLYRLQQGNNVDEIIDEIQKQKENAYKNTEATREALTDARLLLGTGAGQKLSNFYQNLANGRTDEDNVNWLKKKKSAIAINTLLIWTFPSAVILYALMYVVKDIIAKQLIAFDVFLMVSIALGIPLVAVAIALAINSLNNNYPGGYERSAVLWMMGSILSTAATAIYAAILVIQLGPDSGWEEIVPKIIGLLAPAYFIRFCVQNYKANKHLVIQNTHRATLAKVAKQFSELVSHENVTFEQDVLKARVDIVHAAAQVIFTQSESGFLTTKEGAGNGDNMLDSLAKVK